jgi:hypothetical protein
MVPDLILTEFVRILIDLIGAPTEQMFCTEFEAKCSNYVLVKNRDLALHGRPPWPEDALLIEVRTYFKELRRAGSC